MIAPGPQAGPTTTTSDDLPERGAITRAAAGIGVYAGAFGLTFGAVAAAAGLSVPEVAVMSAVMFTGASQFALVGILAGGGAPLAGVFTALLLGVRNAFYGVPVANIVQPRRSRRIWTAHFVIDETTAMAVAQPTQRGGRFAFWATSGALFSCWNLGSIAGALIGSGINTSALGLDAAEPAIFLALLWPQLSRDRGHAVALGAVLLALATAPFVPVGVPIIAAAAFAVLAGWSPVKPRQKSEGA